jgi:hypothetical protein
MSTSNGESLRYQRKGTIHKRGELSIEQDSNGEVVSVWYNCLALPFRISQCDADRAADMRTMYRNDELPQIRSIEVGPELPEITAQKLPDQDDWDASIEERSNS